MKKIFTLFAAVLMAGSMMAENPNLIKFEEPVAAGSLNGVTFGEEFTLTITDNHPDANKRKVSIDRSGAIFGFSETDTISFTHRLKTGAKSSDVNKMTLVVPEEGPLVIYARTGNNNDSTRYFVIANGSDTIVKHICKETDTVADASSKIYLPVIIENVPAGTYDVTYPVNSINFYGFQMAYDEPADPIELEFDAYDVSVSRENGVSISLEGSEAALFYEFNIVNKSIAGLHNDAKQENIVLLVNEEEDYVVDGTAEFTFLRFDGTFYTYTMIVNLVGASGTKYYGMIEIEIRADLSNDIHVGTPSVSTFSTLDDLAGLTITFTGAPLTIETVGMVMLTDNDGFMPYGASGEYSLAGGVVTFNNFITTGLPLPEEEMDMLISFYLVFAYYDMITCPIHYVPAGPTAVENTNAEVKATKLVDNGQVVILRDGKKFNAVGAKL